MYSKIAKDEMEGRLPEGSEVLEWQLKRGADYRSSNKEAQERVFDLQKRKQEIVNRMKQRIRSIDNSEEREEAKTEAVVVTYRDGEYFAATERGEEMITLGELITDGVWGVNYSIDQETFPRQSQKRFFLEQARSEIQLLLDQQIVVHESSSQDTTQGYRDLYPMIMEREMSGDWMKKMGFVAEKMLQNFLIKLQVDNGLDIKVVKADIQQDVEDTIDFVIKKKSHVRAVDVSESKEVNDAIGIQFTLKSGKSAKRWKEGKAAEALEAHPEIKESIDDIIVVSIKSSNFFEVWNEWKDKGMPAGGPDKLWDSQMKNIVFTRMLKGMFSADEMKDQWVRVMKKK